MLTLQRIMITIEGDVHQNTECAGAGEVAGYAVGGFVVGVLITAVLGALILVVIVPRMG